MHLSEMNRVYVRFLLSLLASSFAFRDLRSVRGFRVSMLLPLI